MTDETRDEIRAASAPPIVQEGEARPRITGHFARFNTFNPIDSATEGRFLERIQPGAFKKTLAEQGGRIRMLFQHGRDPEIGDKPIGAPDVLREDGFGPYFEGDLFDSVPPLVVDGLRAGQYGISYRFSVIDEEWDHAPKRSDINPTGLPERTIKQARVYEFGPVTFPADPGADYAVRSLTFADLDAACAASEPDPALPDDAGAQPHDDGSREAATTVPPPIAAPVAKESPKVDISQYRTLDEMGARVRELNAEIERAAQIPGVLPEAEQAAFDTKVDERAALDAAMTAWRQRLELVRNSAPAQQEAPAVIVRKTESDIYDLAALRMTARTPEEYDQKLRDNAMRAVDTSRAPMGDAWKERMGDLLDSADSPDKELARRVLTTGSPQYRRAFNDYVKSGGQERGTALAVGVDGTGGFSVPVILDPTIVPIGAHTTINPFRQACRTVQIVGTDTWRALTATAVTAAYATEAAAADEQGPTFAQPEYIVKRAHAFVTASYEMMQDRGDLAAELGQLFSEAKDNVEENKFAVGAAGGVTPVGMFVDGQFTAVTTVANPFAVGDLAITEAALPIRYRANAVWFLSRAAIRTIQGWETAMGVLFNGVEYARAGNLDRFNPGGNTGLRLLGYPVYETPSGTFSTTAAGTISGVLCDPQRYVIVDRVGMSVRVIPDMLNGATPSFPTGQSGIYAFWRNTGERLNVDAGRQIKVHA